MSTENTSIHNTPAQSTDIPVVYILCEEYENKDHIREFTILCVSNDENYLRQLMQKKIENDQYGFIASKGVDESSLRDNHFSTNYDDGFVEYYILEQPVHVIEKDRPKDKPSLDSMIRNADNKRVATLSEQEAPKRDSERNENDIEI